MRLWFSSPRALPNPGVYGCRKLWEKKPHIFIGKYARDKTEGWKSRWKIKGEILAVREEKKK